MVATMSNKNRTTDDPTVAVAELLAWALSTRPTDTYTASNTLELLCGAHQSLVRREAEHQLQLRIAAAWNRGWLPSELSRHVRRTTDATTASLALIAIGADHVDRAAATIHPRWRADFDRLGPPVIRSNTEWLRTWEQREHVDWRDTVSTIVALLRCLLLLRRLPIIVPPPGSEPGSPITNLAGSPNNPMLDRVRALLAQAESTTFEAEAEAFTAKAQQLMTRHAIDAALLSTPAHHSERPIAIRIAIDEPYVEGKSILLQHVAKHSRCRSVMLDGCALSSIVGLADDVAATEVLFTSLLVQAQAAMLAAAAASAAGAPTRSRSFRSSFLVAYAQRVGQRLEAINARVVTDIENETGASILPVLRARSAVVDEVFAEMFGRNLSSMARRRYDPAGLASGRLAADRAQLNAGDLTAPRRAIGNR